jgi:hypothetical protein
MMVYEIVVVSDDNEMDARTLPGFVELDESAVVPDVPETLAAVCIGQVAGMFMFVSPILPAGYVRCYYKGIS